MSDDAANQTSGELLTSRRIVPAGRDGKKVYFRTLRRGEADSGEEVNIEPGDEIIIPPGGLVIDSREIDDQSTRGRGGYAPVANTVWTWYNIVGVELGFFLFLFSLARRIDAAHSLWTLAIQAVENAKSQGDIARRSGFFNALATAEVAIIALHRGITMASSLIEKRCPDLEMPESVEKIRVAVHEMRNAFEHIDERAEGRTSRSATVNTDALTIFHQPEFVSSYMLRYKKYSVNFEHELIAALLDCRELVMNAIDSKANSDSKNAR